MKQQFKKSDLKTGMFVTLRDGNNYMVLLNYYYEGEIIDVIANCKGNGRIKLNHYDEYLNDNDGYKPYDIISVWEQMTLNVCSFENARKIWKRVEEPKTLTQKEYDFLGMLNKKSYIAKDENGSLFVYEEEPNKSHDKWIVPCGTYLVIPSRNFKFIKWTDEKAYSVEEMLKWDIKG